MAVILCPSSKPCFTTSVPVAPVAPKTRSFSCFESFSSFSASEAAAMLDAGVCASTALRMLGTKHCCCKLQQIAKIFKSCAFRFFGSMALYALEALLSAMSGTWTHVQYIRYKAI